MEVVIRPTAAEGSCLAADLVESVVATTPRAVLGLATGSSPVGLYDRLGHRVATGRVSFAGCRAFLLDEYVGLPTGHPQRYRSVIDEIFVRQVGMSSDSVDGPNGNASDLAEACVEYERRITEAGGVDIQLLGLGSDGHVAFNEPSSSLASRTRLKTLTRRTREDNARFSAGTSQRSRGTASLRAWARSSKRAVLFSSLPGCRRRRPCEPWWRGQCPLSFPRRCCSYTLGSP